MAAASAAAEPPSSSSDPCLADLHPRHRLKKPHTLFPFDIFSGKAHEVLLESGEELGLSQHLVEELGYVRSHCMVPPFPWGHIIYRNYILGNIIPLEVPGHFAEFGIGQGGTTCFFARLAKSYGRKFLAIDSFEGLPPPDTEKDNHYFKPGDYRPQAEKDNYAAFLEYKQRFDIDDTLTVRKGFFKDVEVPAEFDQLAFAHLDSDLYESVYESLEQVWPRLADGGCLVVDDFFHHAQGPARAVSDFFRKHCPNDEPPLLYVVPVYAVLIIKGRSAFLEHPPPESAASGDAGGAAGADDMQSRRRIGTMHSPRALDGNFYSFKLMRMCKPLIRAMEESVRRCVEACEQAGPESRERDALLRTRVNAEAFLAFLRYPDAAVRSGADIFRYLWPLEDQWDLSQGALCGMPGEERRTIEIGI